MSRQRQAIALAVAAAVLLLAGIAGAWLVLRGPGRAQAELAQEPITIRTVFVPLEPQFADPVTAHVDVFVDTRRIDPASVRLRQRFVPYVVTGRTRTERSRRAGGGAALHDADRLHRHRLLAARGGQGVLLPRARRLVRAARRGDDRRHRVAESDGPLAR